jgi:periplasmic protein CpxP/Spy
MKPWLRRTLFGALGASLLVAAFGAGFWSSHHHRWHSMSDADLARVKERAVDHLGRRLDLDAAQKAKLGTLADRLREQRAALIPQGSSPRGEFAALFAGPTFDRAQAQALVNAKTNAVGSKAPEVIAALGDFYDSLSPAQQDKVRSYMNRGRHHGWGG